MEPSIILVERVARMEQQILQLSEQEKRRLVQEEARDRKIDTLIVEMGKYKSFIGGVLFICSCLWAFLKLGVPFIMKLLGK